MKKQLIIVAVISAVTSTAFGQCTSLFSFGTYFETATFYNQSTVANAHYFWNFGDGTGSNYESPIHTFPETGSYLVTLFAKDTVSNCSSYYDFWLDVKKYSTDSCQPSVLDSVFSYGGNEYFKLIDNSSDCNSYWSEGDCGFALNFQTNNWIWFDWWTTIPLRMVSRIRYFSHDTINSYEPRREGYKSLPYNYSSSKNFGDCSANFEFNVVSADTSGQRILFTAMNKSATFYQWYVAGFGSPIYSSYDTISIFYPFTYANQWQTGLYIEGTSGCHDTLFQDILIRKDTNTIASVSEPQSQFIYSVYPNPFLEKVTLTFPVINKNMDFVLYDANGQIVKSIKTINGNQLTVYRDNLATGLYYFMLRTKEKIIAKGKLMAE